MIAPHRRRRRKTEVPGRAQAEALREALEGEAPVRLARELLTSGRPYERREDNFLGFVHLGRIVTLLRQLLG